MNVRKGLIHYKVSKIKELKQEDVDQLTLNEDSFRSYDQKVLHYTECRYMFYM